MTFATGFWELISRDVAFLGGPLSPLLSWLGSVGIVLFFLWKIRKLKKETTTVRHAFDRLRPTLSALIDERGDIDSKRFIPHPPNRLQLPTNQNSFGPSRVDCDDIQKLDSDIQREPFFRGLWAQYRMTLVLEQVPWFMEPRIFSTKRADEVFTQEALLYKHIDMVSYRQFPSVVTSLGLLLTFLALFIGLGKLHAEGSEIVGIQGLINGLAGKFLTSIVGLIVANLFTFFERPMIARVIETHRTFLSLIDQLFPRKTMEQMLEQFTSLQGETKDPSLAAGDIRRPMSEWGMTGLAGPTANLTSAIQTLTKLQQDEHTHTRRSLDDIPRLLKSELHGTLRELTDAIGDLTRLLKNQANHPIGTEPSKDDRPRLWNPSGYPRDSSQNSVVKKISSWPSRVWMTKLRRTG